MVQTLRDKTINGGLWMGIERFATSTFLFVSNIVLARLLCPEDFGILGLLLVFVHLADSIIDGGFGAALIQRKNATDKDFSTIFYWNLFVSILLYVIVFFTAPKFSEWFSEPSFAKLLRVTGIVLIINALCVIQRTKLTKDLNFKKLANINLFSALVATIICIICAYFGFGVWSLVVKVLLTSIFASVFLWRKSNWYPQKIFSIESLKSLFNFGAFMFLTSMVNSLYINIISFVLGKKFSTRELGFFTQARKLQDVPREAVTAIVTNVTFAAFSTIQDDRERLLLAIKKGLATLCFMSFPLTFFLMIAAKPLILLFFKEKWLPSVEYMQIICLYGLLMSIIDFNQGVLKAVGKTKHLFVTGITRKTLGIVMIILGALWGVKGLLSMYVLSQVVGFVIVAFPLGKIINYGLFPQIKQMLPSFLLSLVSAAAVYWGTSKINIESNFILVLIQFTAFCSLYIALNYLFKYKYFFYLKSIAFSKIGEMFGKK